MGFAVKRRGTYYSDIVCELTTIEAEVKGDYKTALQSSTTNPLVPYEKIAQTILDEMLVGHKEHLPQFKERIGFSDGKI